jgi:hypothetical protein
VSKGGIEWQRTDRGKEGFTPHPKDNVTAVVDELSDLAATDCGTDFTIGKLAKR